MTNGTAINRPAALCVAIALAPFALMCAYYYPFLPDDSLISFRYADRFADGRGLTWNDDYRVEGYSNFAWVIALAGLHKLGIEIIPASRLLGITVTGVTLAAFAWQLHRKLGCRVGSLVLTILPICSPIPAIWAVGGLEQPFILASVFFGFLALGRYYSDPRQGYIWRAGAWFALLCLTRPDSPLFPALAAMVLLLYPPLNTPRWTGAIKLLALPVAATLGLLAFRIVYYGDIVPNTAHVKAGGGFDHVAAGLNYLIHGLIAVLPAGVVTILAGRIARAPRHLILLPLLPLSVWLVYLIKIGGDIMPGARHFTPIYALLLVAIIQFATPALVQRIEVSLRATAKLSVPVVILLALALQLTSAEIRRAKSERWTETCRILSDHLKDQFSARAPTMAVTAAGCLPFWTGFTTIDLLGLNDLHIPQQPSNRIPIGFVGHELADLDYLLERAPDLVVFHLGGRPNLGYAVLIENDPRFDERYAEKEIIIPDIGPRLIYVRRGGSLSDL